MLIKMKKKFTLEGCDLLFWEGTPLHHAYNVAKNKDASRWEADHYLLHPAYCRADPRPALFSSWAIESWYGFCPGIS
jgi:hypothetical protein